jgi:hypothetical protein
LVVQDAFLGVMLRRWMRISVCPLAHATGARVMN